MEEQAFSKLAMQARYAPQPPRSSNFHIILTLYYPFQNFPEHQYPSIIGRPILRSEERAGDIVVKDIMCGDEAAAARSMLQITYPVRQTFFVHLIHSPLSGPDYLILMADGKRHHQKMGRHDPPVGLHLFRENENRPHRPQNPPH